MEEWIRIFNEQHEPVGRATRDEAHAKGLWHETFHCWLYDENDIILQKRSEQKADYPNRYDVTAAGHLDEKETVHDGVREMEEELGILFSIDALEPFRVIPDAVQREGWHDCEFAHVFFKKGTYHPNDFTLQKEEVEGLYRIAREDWIALLRKERDRVPIRTLDHAFVEYVRLEDFAIHSASYWKACTHFFNK